MERKCGGCGATNGTRIRVVFHKGSSVESCDRCDPALVHEITIHSTTDRKLWMGHEADPHRYKKEERAGGQVVYVATDEQRADHEAEWQTKDTGETAEAERIMAARQQFGRTDPMTPTEILELISKTKRQLESAEVRNEA